jgi:hypothetical protein
MAQDPAASSRGRGTHAHVKSLLLGHAPHQISDSHSLDFIVDGNFIADKALQRAFEVRIYTLARFDVAKRSEEDSEALSMRGAHAADD